MKVVILAGGYGTRLSKETLSVLKPKPMTEIGEMPIIWHIMKIYSHYGFNDFVVCAGYKQHMIKEWFADYMLYSSDITFDFSNENKMIVHNKRTEPWKVTIVDTGLNTKTGGRIKRIKEYTDNDTFMLTYGDGVGDININDLLKFHKSHGRIGTVSAYNYTQNKGILELGQDNSIISFREKCDQDGELINIGFMVFEQEIFDYLKDDDTIFEQEPMKELASKSELKAFLHTGFWQCMDTKREMDMLENLWARGDAPWKIWKEN